MAGFPSTLTAFTYPTANQRLNSPSHSSVHTEVASAIGNIEALIGRDGNNSVVGTLLYQIRSADSDGGGHVQSANKGGIGQTSYTKGDIIVATSASALTKLAVGGDNQVLKANSSTASGINWATQAGKIYVQNNNVDVQSVTSGTSSIGAQIFSTSIIGSTLGTSNVIRSTSYIRPGSTDTNATSIIALWKYGGNIVASVLLNSAAAGSIVGRLTHTMFASTVSAQRHIVEVDLRISNNTDSANAGPEINFNPANPFNPSVGGIVYGQVISTSSIESSATQTYSGNIRIVNGNGTFMSVAGTIVEAIT